MSTEISSEKKGSAVGRILMVCAALLWGLAGVCVKSISWGTMSVVAARSVLSLILLVAAKRSLKIKFTRNNILGALAMTATGMLYVESIKLTTAGTAIVLQYIAPILVFLFSVIFKHRKAKVMEVILTLVVFGGIILSFADDLDATRILGNVLGLLSGFTFAAQIIIMNGEGTDTQDSLIISCILSFVIALPFAFFDKNLSFDFKNVIWILILGLLQYGLANVIFGIGIKKLEDVEASLILTIEPIFNPVPVAIITGEMMGPLAIIGSAVVIIAITLYGLLPTIERKLKKQ